LQVADMDIDGAAPSSAAASAQPSQQTQPQQGRVHVTELTTAKGYAGSLVTRLACSGSSLVVTESLGSVTVLRALTTPGGRVQLLPVGADQSGLMAIDVALPVQQHIQQAPEQVPAALQGQQLHHQVGPQQWHKSLLVATHPTGLLLLQRDLAAEQQHQSAAHQAAVNAWEAGGAARQAVMFGQAADAQMLWLQQQELLQGVQPLWLGQGEAAPWAGAAAGAAAAGHPPGAAAAGANLAGLAAVAAAAGGLAPPAAPTAVTTAREVGVYNPGAGMAPRLMASAACAPAPGISLMCTAQLGLHAQHLDSVMESSSGSGISGSAGCVPVWCFSPSGAVSVVQMLQPQEARTLLQLQQKVLEQQQSEEHDNAQVWQLQFVPGQQQGQGSRLRWLARLPASASYENYQRDVLRRAAVPQHEDDEEELAFNCVDGDLLFGACMGAAGTAAAAAVEQDGRLLQHLVWQRML
jgi:hypothetical protein